VSADDVVVMFHDPGEPVVRLACIGLLTPGLSPIALERTTDSTGNYHGQRQEPGWYHTDSITSGQIKEREWHGETGMQHVRTIKEPRQTIPTFAETVALLMRVCAQSLLSSS
jgi:glycerophosphoryl diester phosphodiesterase